MTSTVSFREAGAGPGVVCLHANASSAAQWRALMDLLAPRFHALAADSYGAGKSPSWPAGRSITLRDEAALLEPVLERAGGRFSLVGHSYGGAVALMTALVNPEPVRAMALYEPTLFALVEQESPPPNEVDGIRSAVAAALEALRAGDTAGAARCFIDFWMGEGSFERMPERNRAAIAEAVRNVQGWKDALFGEPTPASAFRRLDMPVLLLVGSRSPLSSRAVARRLLQVLPHVECVELEGLGHMAPVTHADAVNARIATFLHRHGG
jgi:pimeloyl-ACP methyl ester carboxylesterase